MKTWILDELADWPDNALKQAITASERVQAVSPLKPSLPDEKPSLEAVLSDCEALNDEIGQLREIARRAQVRELEAVKRLEASERAVQNLSVLIQKMRGRP